MEQFRKSFVTSKPPTPPPEPTYTFHEMVIPGGKIAKLIRVPDPFDPKFYADGIIDHYAPQFDVP